MSIDLEYAIKQDVRNNPVVREVDREQKREFLRTLGWAALGVALLVFALFPRTHALAAGYRLEDLRDDVARETAVQRQLRLQLEVDLRPQALQDRAIHELRMVEPTEHNVLVIDRVPSGTPANRAIVAAVR